MDLEHERRVRRDRAFVVGPARPVRGADLHETRAGLGHDLGHTEAATDLDELTSRHDDISRTGKRREHEQHCGGVVVDDDPGLCSARLGEQMPGVLVARSANPFVDAVLEVRRTRDRRHRDQRVVAERSTTEIRVEEHTGRVDERPQHPRFELLDSTVGVGEHVFGGLRLTAPDIHARGGDCVTRGTGA